MSGPVTWRVMSGPPWKLGSTLLKGLGENMGNWAAESV
jgi:hypothetical protein